MRTQYQEFENAIQLECKLLDLAEKVADELRKPHSLRNVQNMSATWEQMARSQPKMASIGRVLSKIKRPKRGVLPRPDYDAQRQIYLKARSIVKRLRLWKMVGQLVKRHIDPARAELVPVATPNIHDPILTLFSQAFHRLANTRSQDEAAANHGCFADIPMPIQRFEILMSAAYRVSLAQNRSSPVRFLDVGCGGGTKVFAATRFFSNSTGLEYDRGYAEAARKTMRIIGTGHCAIIHGDALTFNCYDDYDVIYFYRPLQSDELLTEMERRIIYTSRPGTILIAPYDTNFETHYGMTCARLEGPVFVTGLSQAEADQLRVDAEATSTELIKRSTDFRFDTGFWTPILNAASFNGYP